MTARRAAIEKCHHSCADPRLEYPSAAMAVNLPQRKERHHPWAEMVMQTNSTLEAAVLYYHLDREYFVWMALRCLAREIYGEKAVGVVKNRLYHIKVLAARTPFNEDTIRRWLNSAQENGFLRIVGNDIHLVGQKALTRDFTQRLLADYDRTQAEGSPNGEGGLPRNWIVEPFSFSFTWAEFARSKSRQQRRALICERLALWLNTKGWSRCVLATIARVERRSTQRWNQRADTHRASRFVGYDFDQWAAAMGLHPHDVSDFARSQFAAAVVAAEKKWAQREEKQALFVIERTYGRPMLAMQVSNKYLSQFTVGMAPARALRHDLRSLSGAAGHAPGVRQPANPRPTGEGSLDAVKHGVGYIPDGFKAKFADHFTTVMEEIGRDVLRRLGIQREPMIYATAPAFETMSSCVYVPSRGWSSSSPHKLQSFL